MATTAKIEGHKLIKGKEIATGLSNKLVAQTGEYLVAAKLSRRGLIA